MANDNVINMDDDDISDDEEEENLDKIDINYNFLPENQNLSGQMFTGNKNIIQKNKSNFQKIGTMLNKNMRKISIAEQNKRNSQFQNNQTQLIIENLSPFILNTNIKNQFQNEPLSPDPNFLGGMRPFSPLSVSEFDEGENKKSKNREDKVSNNNSRILNQFNNQRKAFSPMVRPLGIDKGRNIKSPVPDKRLPLITNETPVGILSPNTPLVGGKKLNRNNNRIKIIDVGGNTEKFESDQKIRSNSRNKKTKFNTIDPLSDLDKDSQYNQTEGVFNSKFGSNKAVPELNTLQIK